MSAMNHSTDSIGDVSATSNPSDREEQVKQLKRNNKRLREERDKLGEEYDQVKAQLETEEEAKKELVKANKRLEDQLHGLLKTQEENVKLRRTADELQKKNNQLKLDAETLRGARNALSGENERLQTARDEAFNERDGIKRQLDDALKVLHEVNEKYEAEVRDRPVTKEACQCQQQALPAPPEKRARASLMLTAFLILMVFAWLSYRVSVSMEDDVWERLARFSGVFTLFGDMPSFLGKSDYSLGPR